MEKRRQEGGRGDSKKAGLRGEEARRERERGERGGRGKGWMASACGSRSCRSCLSRHGWSSDKPKVGEGVGGGRCVYGGEGWKGGFLYRASDSQTEDLSGPDACTSAHLPLGAGQGCVGEGGSEGLISKDGKASETQAAAYLLCPAFHSPV